MLGGLGPASVGRRISAAAQAAGSAGHITAHSGRIGLATELTRGGASIQEVMLVGNWSSARMVAHYCAGPQAESGAAAKYLQVDCNGEDFRSWRVPPADPRRDSPVRERTKVLFAQLEGTAGEEGGRKCRSC